jgi:hypothetical protein
VLVAQQDLELHVGLPVWLFLISLDVSFLVSEDPDKDGLHHVQRILNVSREATISIHHTGRKMLFTDHPT